MKKVIFISSTGGHLSELLQLASLFEKTNYTLITEKTKSTESLTKRYPGKVHYLTYGTREHLVSYLFKFSWNCLVSFVYFLRFRPDIIITTGTHTAVPMCYIGHFFKKKVVFIETFANSETPTQAGKLVYPIADLFVVQWESMKKHYPNAKVGGWIF